MRICIHTFSVRIDNKQTTDFVLECFKKIIAQYPQHAFIFITDNILPAVFLSSKNVTVHHFVQPKTSVRWQWWYHYQLPSFVKKHKIDLLIHADNCCAFRTTVPQLLVSYDLSFLHTSSVVPKKNQFFYKKYFIKSLEKTTAVVVPSASAKQEILNRQLIEANKIHVIHTGINELYQPIENKESVKQQFAHGKEFFLYNGSSHNIHFTNLLKAFSFFKKRLKSNMELIIASSFSPDDPFLESLKTYKYKNDVHVLTNLADTELASITAAAYALVCPVLFENNGQNILQAMQANTPVIASDIEVFHELFGEAVLYTSSSFEDIADKMMLLFKDENKRNELIEKGKQQSLQYDWNKTAAQLWELVAKTVE